jgi:quercetin dioxygenase-like cupin family protein
MEHDEAKNFRKGKKTTHYYDRTLKEVQRLKKKDERLQEVVRAKDMPWENSRHGRLKHVANDQTNARIKTLDIYIQEIPPGGHSGKHRHMAEEYIFVLEGRGYDLHWDVNPRLEEKYHWDVEKEPKRFEWEAGDVICIPVNTIHQHFNSDPYKPARFISGSNRIYKHMGFHDLEQIEDAPKIKGL